MAIENSEEDRGKRLRGWAKFFAGLMALVVFAGFFASGYSPPGAFGEVLRHNQANDIDASPLLYSEVEHMTDLENGIKAQMERAATRSRGPESSSSVGQDD